MTIKTIKVPTYKELMKYKDSIIACLKKYYDTMVTMWLSDSPAQYVTIDCREGHTPQVYYYCACYGDPLDTVVSDLYILMDIEPTLPQEIVGFDYYDYDKNHFEIIEDNLVMMINPLLRNITHNQFQSNQNLLKNFSGKQLFPRKAIRSCRPNEYVPGDLVSNENKTDLSFMGISSTTKIMRPYLKADFGYRLVDDLKDASTSEKILTLVKQPNDSEFDYILYAYVDNEFVVVEKFYRDPVKQGREQVYVKIKEVIDFLDKEVDDAVEPDACSIGIRAIEKLEAIIKEEEIL